MRLEARRIRNGFVFETKPDYLLILAWNIKEEVMQQMGKIRSWDGRFVIPIPHLSIVP